ncbi:MAG: hypothetical protein KF752_16435 [Pirellulaceae bacterium]|nr:hypothetical protein [Pirellulaceae bacterium]
MHLYENCCDEFYANMYLQTEMRLPRNRETLLHFFDQIRRRHPNLTNFYARQRGEYCIDQEKVDGQYRWVSIEQRRLCSGAVNPTSLEAALAQHRSVLDIAPYDLSLGRLDCESLNFTMGFDFHYRGNHSQLLAEALGMVPALERLSEVVPGPLLGYEPTLQFALDEDCRTQARINFESRSTAYQVRTGEFGEEGLSVHLTVRRYASLSQEEQFTTELERLAGIAGQLVNDYLVENILQPLQQMIALK